MRLSVSAWCVQDLLFSGKTSLFEFIDFCQQNKVDGIELLDCFWKNEEQIAEVKKYLDEINLRVSAYSIGNDFVGDEDTRKNAVQLVKKGVDVAVFLGAKYLRVFSGNVKENVSFKEGKNWIIDCFRECAPYAESKEITMVLENHGLFAGKSSQVKEIIDLVNSSALKANSDTGNFLLVGEDPLSAVKNLSSYISFVHFKDFRENNEGGYYTSLDRRKYEGTVIGKGEVPVKEIVDFLYSIGYKGYLSLEFEGTGDPYKGTQESINFTKAIIK